MTINSSDLLRSLGGVVRPGLNESGSTSGTPRLIEGQTFDQLLQQAKDGELSSGVPIRIDSRSGLKLSDTQSARLAKAADQAEAQGAGRAVVLMDGMTLTMDVATRTITGRVDTSKAATMTGIDTIISVPPEEGAASNPTAMLPKASLASLPPGLLKALNADDTTETHTTN